jgi:hypothetical protein
MPPHFVSVASTPRPRKPNALKFQRVHPGSHLGYLPVIHREGHNLPMP